MRGYELYSSSIADVLSEPSLNTPITVGLYAKWGNGKSYMIEDLISECILYRMIACMRCCEGSCFLYCMKTNVWYMSTLFKYFAYSVLMYYTFGN